MAETFGSLCDKLTIVILKKYHTDEVNTEKLKSLSDQQIQLQDEINEFLNKAINGTIPKEKLTFSSNKVYKESGNEVSEAIGDIGEVFSELADVNCLLWHEQEKVYEFETVPVDEKDKVVKQLAILNLRRNKCIDRINNRLKELVNKR